MRMTKAFKYYVTLTTLGLSVLVMSACGCGSRTPHTEGIEVDRQSDLTMDTKLDEQGVRAPDFKGATAWLNTKPLSINDLRGQVVLIDFWTYCCINCMHVLPELAKVEEAFKGQPLVVLGVHSAKFKAERDPARIQEAMARYHIRHPVAVDSEMKIWEAYAVNSWPTLVLVRPNGRIAAVWPGENNASTLKRAIEQVMSEARKDNTLANKAKIVLQAPERDLNRLSFPGKLATFADGRVVIADSGNHRLLIVDSKGQVLERIGSTYPMLKDGSFDKASFNDPQGIAIDPTQKTLYVADTKNHAIRKVDLNKKEVSTIAGTGDLGHSPLRFEWREARATILRSPWDLTLAADANTLYVAMAGSHQIAELDLSTLKIKALAGTGEENIRDGAFDEAAFAQPSGLSLNQRMLYVADSETSSVRRLDLQSHQVQTLVGSGLFDFGDQDGALGAARLQHPLHVLADARQKPLCGSNGQASTKRSCYPSVLVADTYNSKIKRLNEDSIRTVFAGTSHTTGQGLRLREPGGMAFAADGALLIANTGLGSVVRVDPHDMTKAGVLIDRLDQSAQVNQGAMAPTRPITYAFVAPAGHEFSEGSPYELTLSDGTKRVLASSSGEANAGLRLVITLSIPKKLAPLGAGVLVLDAVVCDAKDHAYCKPFKQSFKVPAPNENAGPLEFKLASVNTR